MATNSERTRCQNQLLLLNSRNGDCLSPRSLSASVLCIVAMMLFEGRGLGGGISAFLVGISLLIFALKTCKRKIPWRLSLMLSSDVNQSAPSDYMRGQRSNLENVELEEVVENNEQVHEQRALTIKSSSPVQSPQDVSQYVLRRRSSGGVSLECQAASEEVE